MNESLRQSLQAFITEKSGASQVQITEAKRLSGGAIQENWLIHATLEGGDHAGVLDAVVRTDSPSGVSASHSRAEEFAILKAVFGAGVTVPEPLWLCEDLSVIGRQFFIMRRIGGTAAGHLLVKDGRYGGDRVRLAERLGEELARIHSVRPPRADLPFLVEYSESPAAHSIQRLRDFLDAQAIPRPALEWGLRWLERHEPASEAVVLCHRDFRTGNYMVDEQGLTGILDWEFSDWGDPLEDIGWFCAKCWRFGATDREAGGVGAREDFYRGYQRVSGMSLDPEQVRYWEVVAHMNWAMIAIQQAERYLSGEEASLFLALTGHIVPELEYEILKMTENG